MFKLKNYLQVESKNDVTNMESDKVKYICFFAETAQATMHCCEIILQALLKMEK